MKFLTITFLLVILAVDVSAQAPSVETKSGEGDAPALAVLQTKIYQIRYNSGSGNLRVDDDPFRANDEHRAWRQTQQEIINENVLREKAGQARIPPTLPNQLSSEPVTPAPNKPVYVYEFEVRNLGAKKILNLTWDFVLVDPDSKLEVGSHRFTTKTNISSGKSKKLIGTSYSPPTQVVDASKAGSQLKGHYKENVVIHRIDFEDGSSWQRVN